MPEDSAIQEMTLDPADASEQTPRVPPPRAGSCRWQHHATLALLSLALALFVFRPAVFTGRNLLAPLDVAPAFYAHYHWLDGHADGIPENHYVIDIFDHELPRQYSIYQAIRRGEFPWWDPYTDSGRPLVAEAHIGGTDPIRLALYRLLPFELAYNWSKLISHLLFGLGCYLLLQRLRLPGWLCVLGALTYQFASNHLLFQTPLCVSSAFAYYALLWWSWDRLATGFRWPTFLLAGLLCAGTILAGNQQTQAYLAIFTFCFLAGYGFRNQARWRSLALTTLGPVTLGCLLALPVLVAQIELFLLCQATNASSATYSPTGLTGLANLSAFFPWVLGTFRTLDAAKSFHQTFVGFSVYLGSAALILAVGGAALCFAGKAASGLTRTALLLVVIYELICLSPLVRFLYIRCSDLAVLGLIVLCATAANALWAGEMSPRVRRALRLVCLACISTCLAANVLAFLLIPRLEARMERYVLERDQTNPSLPPAPELRRFQLASLQREISLLNPETVAALASVVSLFYLLGSPKLGRPASRAWPALLAINLVPLLLFAHRFVVSQPVTQWDRLIHEDSEQTRLAKTLGRQCRLNELGNRFSMIFPSALAHLYGVHTSTGYSSFHLAPMVDEVQAQGLKLLAGDAEAVPGRSNSMPAKLVFNRPPSGTSRFQWTSPALQRSVTVVDESLNRITVKVDAGPAGTLLRTDRYYPGWRVLEPLPSRVLGRSLLAVDVPAQEMAITFAYEPRLLGVTLPLSLATGALMLLVGAWRCVRRVGQTEMTALGGATSSILLPGAAAAGVSAAERDARGCVALDQWRGLALLLVLVSHGFFASGRVNGIGRVGVNLFFFISGVLVFRSLSRTRAATSWQRTRSFWWRRFRRLYPALLSYTLAMLPIVWLTRHWPDLPPGSDFSAYVKAMPLVVVYAVNYFYVPMPFGHLWSLACEMQFYFVAPLIYLAGGLTEKRRFGVFGVLLVVLMGLGLAQPLLDKWKYHFEFAVWPMMLGFCCEWKRNWFKQIPAPWVGLLFWLSVGACAAVLFGSLFGRELKLLVIMAGTLLLAPCLLAYLFGRPMPGAPGRALQWLGERTYSIYLWQQPFTLCNFLPPRLHLVGSLAAVAVGGVWFHLFERPFLSQNRRK